MKRLWAFVKSLAAPRRLVPACYILAAAGWLLVSLFGFVYDRARPETVLDLAGAETVQLEAGGDGRYTTVGGDAGLVFTGVGATARQVLLAAEFEGKPGEMDAFYTRRAGQAFSAGRGFIGIPQPGGEKKPLLTLGGRRAIGRPVEAGWLYTLPPGRVEDLRVDLGTAAGNGLRVTAVTLNPRLPASHYFVPTLRTLAGLALWPALASCLILTIIELITFARRTPRHRQKGNAPAADNEA